MLASLDPRLSLWSSMDSMSFSKLSIKRATSVPPNKRNGFSRNGSSLGSAGAVDEEVFLKAFQNTPDVHYSKTRNLEQEINQMRDTLSDSSVDWQRRVELLTRFRGFIAAGPPDNKDFIEFIKPLEVPFQLCVKDLRSQVVRETCITIAFISVKLGLKCSRFAETILPTLINLIPNSAKIMSSSALVAIRFIIDHTRAPRLISIITYNLSSKSKEIRRSCYEFLDQIVHTWQTSCLEKNVATISSAIKKGISDADPEARLFARKAFWGFSDHFKEAAESLLNSLDLNKQKQLRDEHISMSNSSSTNSLVQVDGFSLGPQSQSFILNRNIMCNVSSSNSVENLSRPTSSLSNSRYRSKIPVFNSPRINGVSNYNYGSPARSTSSIDVGAARRAQYKAAIAAASAKSNSLLNDISRLSGLKKSPIIRNIPKENCISSSCEKNGSSRLSHSQPGSRSVSPLSWLNHTPTEYKSRVHRNSCIPVSENGKLNGAKLEKCNKGIKHIAQRNRSLDDHSDESDSSINSDRSNYLIGSGSPKEILRNLIEKISDNENSMMKSLYFGFLYELLLRHPDIFKGYIELTILRILEASKDNEKEVQRASETAAEAAAGVLPADQCLIILKKMIATKEPPMNQAAIKMLCKMIEKQNKDVIEALLTDMMPVLILAYDNPESAVRKAAVFSMVAVYNKVGDKMKPYLAGLSGSKMKLLQLYIDRAKSKSTQNSNNNSNSISPVSSN